MRRSSLLIAAVAVSATLLLPTPAWAMHLSEGILPIGWSGLWFLVAIPFVLWGLHTINRRRSVDPLWPTMVALVGSAVFVVSCMPVPIPLAGTCSHPCGTGLAAILIGPAATVVVSSIALLLQAMFLTHGGLTTLGANIVSMGIVGAYCAYGSFRLLRTLRVPTFVAAFAAGLLSDWATYAMTSFQLSAALHDGSLGAMFAAIMMAFVPTQVPLGIAEGVLTAMAYRFVWARRPELLSFHARLEPALGNDA